MNQALSNYSNIHVLSDEVCQYKHESSTNVL